MVFTRRRFLAPLLLLATAVTLLAAPPGPALDRIVYQRGYVITAQEDFALTLTLPKSRLPDGIPAPRETAPARRTELRLPAWSDGTTTVYLDDLCYANEDPGQLYATFSFGYDLRPSGQLVLPYRVELKPDGTTASFLTSGPARSIPATDARTAYPGAVSLRANGPGEELTFYLDTAVFQAAEGDLTFPVDGLTALRYRPA